MIFNNQRFTRLLALAALVLPLTAQAKVFKIATISPDGSSWMVAMKSAASEVEKRTEGRVQFKFYPGGVMGNDQTVFRKMRAGQLQGTAAPGGSLARNYKDGTVYNLPLLFRDFDEVDSVRAKLDDTIVKGLEDGGMVTFGLAEGGMAYVMSKQPIRSVEDLRRSKVWAPSDDEAALTAIQAFGINPVSLSIGDVLTALQSNMIDTVATSPIGAIALQWHTQVKYVTNVPLLYFYAVLAVDKKAFNTIAANDQTVVREVMTKAFADIDKGNRKDNLAAMEALQKQGLQLVDPDSQQLLEWQQQGASARAGMVSAGHVSKPLASQVELQLMQRRSNGKTIKP